MILCQKCGAINRIGEESCQKCGSKLMIISYSDHPNGLLPSWEEHLLERISSLEYTVGRLDDRLNEIHDLVHQLTTESFYDHTMIESIAGALKRLQLVGKRELENDWQRRVTQRLVESEEREKFEARKKDFLNAFRGKDKKQFVRLIDEGSQYFIQRNYQRGLQSLEKAFAVDPQNCEVGIFLSKIYYEFENFSGAGKCLRRVLKSNPHHFEANLLSGLLARHKADFDKARRFLTNAAHVCQTSPATHAVLGSVLLTLGEDTLALAHFSRALDLKPAPQMYLLVGASYCRQGKLTSAIKHLRKAIEMDPRYDEAFFQLGLAFWGHNWRRKARECIQRAIHLNPKEFRYKSALNLFLRNSKKTPQSLESRYHEDLSDRSIEFLVKHELRLDFLRPQLDVARSEEGK
jgi:tetratricopeptide (TPR) repeat protein